MSHADLPNPFEVLRLEPSACNEEVVAQAGRLRQRAVSDAELAAIRQAVQILTASAEERCVQAMLTHPEPRYHWPALEQFRAAYRRAPKPVGGTAAPMPPLDLDEFAGLLRPILGELLDVNTLPGWAQDLGEPVGENQKCSASVEWRNLVEQFPG
jgi:hypothetical protein